VGSFADNAGLVGEALSITPCNPGFCPCLVIGRRLAVGLLAGRQLRRPLRLLLGVKRALSNFQFGDQPRDAVQGLRIADLSAQSSVAGYLVVNRLTLFAHVTVPHSRGAQNAIVHLSMTSKAPFGSNPATAVLKSGCKARPNVYGIYIIDSGSAPGVRWLRDGSAPA
jgi:hypothetical protein